MTDQPAADVVPAGPVVACSAARTPRRWCSASAWRRDQWLQLDDVVVHRPHDARRRGRPRVGHGHRDPGRPRGRPLRLRRVPHRRRAAPGADLRGGRGDDHPDRARDRTCRRCRAPRCGAPTAPSATRRSTSTAWRPSSRSGSAATASRCTLNLEFLDGTRGAHVNISGISGVATKTSYATFLLYSLFHSGVLGAEAANTKALVFNVKGEDLLFLDQPNIRLTDDRTASATGASGCRPSRSTRVAVYAPPRRGDPNAGPDVSTRTSGVHTFYWTLEEFCEQELLPFVFADAEDERQQYTMVVHHVDRQAARDGQRGRRRRRVVDRRHDVCARYEDLVDLVVDRVTDEETALDWAGRAVGMGTINAFVRRLLLVAAAARRRSSAADVAAAPRRTDPHVRRAGHGRRPPQPPRPGQALRRRRHDPQKAFEDKEQRARPAAAVRRARRAEQVRAARGQLADQGDPARRRRARPHPRHDPHRRPADRQRGRAARHRQLGAAGRRPARRRRGGPARVRLPARGPPPAGHDRQARHHVRQPARDPRAAGDRVPVPGVGHPALGATPATLRATVGPAPSDEFDGVVVRLLHTADWHLGQGAEGRRPPARAARRPGRDRGARRAGGGRPRRRRRRRVRVGGAGGRGPAARLRDAAGAAGHRGRRGGRRRQPRQRRRLRGGAPVFAAAGITVLGRPCPPDAGGVVVLVARRPASPCAWRCCRSRRSGASCAPSTCSTSTPPTTSATPSAWRRRARLTAGFDGEAVNVLVAHGTVTGALRRRRAGGAEHLRLPRARHRLPASATYVALGHLHRTQEVPARPGVVRGLADRGRLRRGGRHQPWWSSTPRRARRRGCGP